MYLKDFVDNADPKVTEGARQRYSDLEAAWKGFEKERDEIIFNQMEAYNQAFQELELPAIILNEK